jgi:cytochrome P450
MSTNAASLDILVEARYNPERAEIPLSAVYGNIWVFILGGYHTSANTLHFIFILLAIYPGVQRVLQASLDALLGSRPPSTWSHESDFPILLDGPLGAVIAETVRLFGVLPFIPKSTGPRQPQLLKIGNEEYTIPANTLLLINTSAVHRNPKHWPVIEPKAEEEPPYPVSSWNPWRWLSDESDTTIASGEDAQLGCANTKREGPKRDRGLFRPSPGTYITFSEGARQCIGKRFAQVELCAVLARVLKEGSVELVVKKEEGEKAWALARERAVKELSRGVGFKMALELFGKVELAFVKRGEESVY